MEKEHPIVDLDKTIVQGMIVVEIDGVGRNRVIAPKNGASLRLIANSAYTFLMRDTGHGFRLNLITVDNWEIIKFDPTDNYLHLRILSPHPHFEDSL